MKGLFNPYASTHRRQTLSSSFKANERERKRQYNRLWKLSMALSLRSFLAPLVDVKGRPITFYRLGLRNSPAGRILRAPSSCAGSGGRLPSRCSGFRFGASVEAVRGKNRPILHRPVTSHYLNGTLS